MSDVKVIQKRLSKFVNLKDNSSNEKRPKVKLFNRSMETTVIGIGASTGGTQALQGVLSKLPRDFSIPIVVVQHNSIGFVRGFLKWMNGVTCLKVCLAQHGVRLKPRTIYVAPDHHHVGVTKDLTLTLSGSPPLRGIRPSVSYLFESLGRNVGGAALGVILSGMGDDGVTGLEILKKSGGVVIAQNEASSVIFGMPGKAIEAGITDAILPPEQICRILIGLR